MFLGFLQPQVESSRRCCQAPEREIGILFLSLQKVLGGNGVVGIGDRGSWGKASFWRGQAGRHAPSPLMLFLFFLPFLPPATPHSLREAEGLRDNMVRDGAPPPNSSQVGSKLCLG